MKFYKFKVKSLELVMKPERSKKYQRNYMISQQNVNLSKISLKSEEMRLKMKRRDLTNNISCSRIL